LGVSSGACVASTAGVTWPACLDGFGERLHVTVSLLGDERDQALA
jgi:hypothetical protein